MKRVVTHTTSSKDVLGVAKSATEQVVKPLGEYTEITKAKKSANGKYITTQYLQEDIDNVPSKGAPQDIPTKNKAN